MRGRSMLCPVVRLPLQQLRVLFWLVLPYTSQVGSVQTLKPIFSSVCAVCLEEDSTRCTHLYAHSLLLYSMVLDLLLSLSPLHRGQPPSYHPLSLLLFGSHDHMLYCCCVTTRSKQHKALKTLWTFTTESPVYATPCVSVVFAPLACCTCWS